MPSYCLRLVMVAFMMTLAPATACPEFCVCFDGTFVTCSNFKLLDLALLPPGIDTLSLSTGDVDELTPGFLAMATSLKVLEMTSVNVRVVRGGAFRGLSNLERFAISESTFDIIEPDSFRGLSDIQDVVISQCKFGRVGKHAFSYISGIIKFAILSSSFEVISEEAFYQMSEVLTLQLYKNNITSLGRDVFAGVSEVDDVTIYDNNIDHLAEGTIEKLADAASRFLFYANNFVCSCELAWALTKEQMQSYLSTNRCVFPGEDDKITVRERTFRLSDLTLGALCVHVDESKSTTEVTLGPLLAEDTTSRSEVYENKHDYSTTPAPSSTSSVEAAGNLDFDEFLHIESDYIKNLPTQKRYLDGNTDSTVTQDTSTQEMTTETVGTEVPRTRPTDRELVTTELVHQGLEVDDIADSFHTEKMITSEETNDHDKDHNIDDSSELLTSLTTTTRTSAPSSQEFTDEDDTPPSSPHLPLDTDSNTNVIPEDAISTEESRDSGRGRDASYDWDENQDSAQTDPTRYDVAKDNVALAVSDTVDEGDDDTESNSSQQSERRARTNPESSATRPVARLTAVLASLCFLSRLLHR